MAKGKTTRRSAVGPTPGRDAAGEQEGQGRAANRLVGTWERQGLGEARQIKMFTDAHFAWVVHERQTGRALAVGGGTYRLDGGTLKEKYEYSSAPQLVGAGLTLTVEFQGEDAWRQSGAATVPGISLDETYHRVK
jgi:hypothetical protein